jgi:pimeloyl-ACP methyl ester carboxylesterase
MPYITNKGVNIHYDLEGEGPPLVMLNGLWGSVVDWYDFGYVEQLKDDYQLILIDHRGHGKSDKPYDSEKYSMKLFVEDIVAVLGDLAIKQCHFYGFSMGGWFIYGLAKYYPEKLKSIIIADGVPGLGDSEFVREIVESAKSFEEFVESREGLTALDKERLYSNDRKAINAIADWMEREIREMMKLVEDAIEKLNVPSLVLMSNLPEESGEFALLNRTANEIPNAELAKYGDLSHLGLFIRGDLTLPKIKEFLAKASNI